MKLLVVLDSDILVPLLWLPTKSLKEFEYSERTDIFTAAMGVYQAMSFGLHPYIEMHDIPTPEKRSIVVSPFAKNLQNIGNVLQSSLS